MFSPLIFFIIHFPLHSNRPSVSSLSWHSAGTFDRSITTFAVLFDRVQFFPSAFPVFLFSPETNRQPVQSFSIFSPIVESVCVVCFEMVPEVMFACRHGCVCLECFARLIPSATARVVCPLCRHPGDSAVLIDMKRSLNSARPVLDPRKNSSTLFKIIKRLLSNVSRSTFDVRRFCATLQTLYSDEYCAGAVLSWMPNHSSKPRACGCRSAELPRCHLP